jgi:hypothetical protein
VIGQRRINERFLPVEGFRRATAWQAISVQFALDDFWKKFRDCPQPEPVPPVPSVQGFSQHKLTAVRIVAEVQR